MSNTMILKDKSVQVSRIRRSSSFVMKRPHYHSYYEIYYLLSGKCKMFINQDIYYLEPGDMTIIPPLEVHKACMSQAGRLSASASISPGTRSPPF